MERRSLLARLATAGGAAALAGCSGLFGRSDGSSQDDDGETDANGTPTLTPVPVTSADGESGGTGDDVVTVTPTPTLEPRDYDGWLRNVEPYAGRPVDYRGFETVTVQVGGEGNGGQFAFVPAAVLVDRGATVRWKWTGEGGGHDVVAENGAFESDVVADAGYTFEHEFTERGVYRYACEPHEPLGARGVVEVV